MLDYLLGNGHSLAADRKLADEVERAVPDVRTVVQLGRMFVRSAITQLVRTGVRQFLKYGSDVATFGGVHAMARAADPHCRVLYVDTDPIAVTHGRLTLADDERAAVILTAPLDPDAVAAHPETVLDPDQPVGLLLVDVLRFLPEPWDPPAVLARFADRLAPGSHLVLAHLSSQPRAEEAAVLTKIMAGSTEPVRARTRTEIACLFTGFELVGPGVSNAGEWIGERELTPAEQAAATQFYVGVGCKPLPGKRRP